MPPRSAVHGSPSALDRALGNGAEPEPVAHFLDVVAPGEVRSALRHCLSPGGADPVLHLVRAKLKPGRKLTAEYDVAVAPAGPARRIWVTWVAPGVAAPGPAPDLEAEARRRGVLAPFRRSWVASDEGTMTVSVAPVDGAFPQLVRLHDPVHLLDVVRTTGAAPDVGEVAVDDVTVETVRYRPGQRHVLRVGAGGDRPALFAKVYRDETGRRTVEAAARVASVLAAAGDGAVVAGPGTYAAADGVAFWPEVTGVPLSAVITLSGAAAGDAVRAAGATLRLLHDAAPSVDGSLEGLPASPDAVAQAAETLRTAQLVDVLVPAVGARLRLGVGRVLDVLAGLPAEPPTVVHGDLKCDNLIVNGSRVHLLDFDRCGWGDPAADIGKFLADLRWWTAEDGAAAARLQEAFLDGYGAMGLARAARARAFDVLLQLRMAARRVPIQDPEWARRVTRLVAVAAAAPAGESRP